MAVTVKKKKLTVKTVKARKPDEEALPVDGAVPVEGDAAAPDAAAEPAVVPAAMAAPALAGSAVKPASYTLAGVLAIITFLFFTALIILQYMEWSFFMDAFPRPNMALPSVPSYTATPAASDAAPIEEVTETPAAPAPAE